MFRISVGLAAWLLLALPAGARDQQPPDPPYVVVCPIEGMIDDGIKVLVDRAVRQADKAEAIIFTVDTFGGRVDSAINIANSIMDAPCPTVAYIVGKGAISAGALISYACDHIVMEPGTNMGAAAPVFATMEGMEEAGEKEVSVVAAKMRALAEEHGHNPDIAEAMVDKDIELRAKRVGDRLVIEGSRKSPQPGGEDAPPNLDPEEIIRRITEGLGRELPGPMRESMRERAPKMPESLPPVPEGETPPEGEIVLPAGKLLTLSTKEALAFGVIPATANTIEEVMEYYGYSEAEPYHLEMTWAERLFRFLTDPIVAGFLLMLGIGGIYFELKTPGFGAPGVLGIVCLTLFFGAHYIIGLAEWIDLLLVVAGVVLILLEVFVLPGFGIAGVSGILCLLVGVYLSLTDFTIPEYSWQYQRLQDAALTLSITLASTTVFIALIIRILPQTPIYRHVVLQDAQLAELGYTVQSTEQARSAIGLRGVATSVLRPAGRGRFDGKTYDVVSRGEYIEEGNPIVIVEVDGNRYVVEKAEDGA